jgi:hypothetical protein
MRSIQRIVLVASALMVTGLTSGCFYSHTVDKTPPTVVTTTPAESSSTTTTTSDNGLVERHSTTAYTNP